ncbi:MAG: F0F1 ATP synthase subunit delta [Burkholderiales bacterium]|jgi:F-type H+-transporting ATPase subunit delta|nr:F0F1 ATP synthase subunit delta [Burkholderiales bacterium]
MINNTSLAHPYANAVFDFALAANNLDKWFTDLANLANLAQNDNFTKLTTNPNLSRDAVIQIIVSFVDEPSKELSNFLSQLQDNNKLTILPEIFTLFEQQLENYRNCSKVVIQSAFELNEEQKLTFQGLLSKKFGKTVSIQVEVVPELIGGVKVLINDKVVDYSIKGSLDNLATEIIK